MQLKGKKILVTGAAGFIGSHVTESLLNQGAVVVGIDNFDPFYGRDLKEKNLSIARSNERFTFIEMDITETTDWKLVPNDIDVVIHLAAKAGVLPSIKNPLSYFNTNIIGTSQVLAYMKENNIVKLIFGSSSSVYGDNTKTPFTESDNVDYPISPYAQSKRSCELLNYTYHHLFNIDILNLRFFTVYGPRQRPDLAIHKFLKLILLNEPITIYGDGTSARDYTYVEDTTTGITNAVEYIMRNDNIFETINLGNKSPIKLNELINIIYQTAEKTQNTIHEDSKPGDVRITFADNDKAEKLLDYHPKTSIVNGIQKFYNWYIKNLWA